MDTFANYNKKLAGYKDVSETVKILEKIAAGQLHNLQQQSVALSEYTRHILTVLGRMYILSDDSYVHAKNTPTTGKSLLVIVTGDKGLVGDLWRRLCTSYQKTAQQDVLVIGKKGQQELPQSDSHVTHYSFSARIPSNEDIHTLGALLNSYIEDTMYTAVSTVSLHSESLVEQIPVHTQLLPIAIPETALTSSAQVTVGYPIIEGSIKALRETLYKKYLLSRLQQIILETAVAEFSARTIAMEHASTKTDEATKHLTMVYSRDRRQSETQKQLERFATNNNAL